MTDLQKKVIAVIPARYGSSRLPGKPLADICGKPMIQHVYEKACAAEMVDEVIVATDDQRIAIAVNGFGGKCIMTSEDHPSGTDRLVEVMSLAPADIYLNIQGDEPLIKSAVISRLATYMLANETVQIGTLCHPISSEEAESSNTVKVVVAANKEALYFSRSPIPYPRQAAKAKYLKHIGVYAYRRKVLEQYQSLPASMLEQSELLEQLRLLEAGWKISVLEVDSAHPGVDTPECLERVRKILKNERYDD